MSVERVLHKHNIEYSTVSTSYQVRCLNPDHTDNNPSMFINKYSGWANCRSCGASYNVYELFDEKADWLTIRKDKFREKLRKVSSESKELEFPETTVMWRNSYRGLSPNTLLHFEAFQCADFPGYICFPIRNHSNKIVNFLGRDTTNTKKNKYLFFHKRPVPMFPSSSSTFDSVILVEGLFDMLNLFDKGLKSARAIFGTTTFSDSHITTLKLQGISEVILMLDGDKAGIKAAKEIKDTLEKNYIFTKTISLPEGTDPGDLSKSQVLSIKEKLYG